MTNKQQLIENIKKASAERERTKNYDNYGKKNLKVSALKYEINTNLDKLLKVLEKFELVEKSECWFESRAYDWIDDNPSEKEMDEVLKELGY